MLGVQSYQFEPMLNADDNNYVSSDSDAEDQTEPNSRFDKQDW